MRADESDRDRDLAGRFEEQRRADTSFAPSFSELLARPRRRRYRSGARMPWRLVRGAVMVLVIAAAAATFLRRTSPVPDAELLATASALATWKAPSDSLLETPGADLLRQLPAFESPTPSAAPTPAEPI